MSENPFDDLTDLYEALIDWPARLAREAPFYQRLFAQLGAARVLDTACGTGRHAELFHQWGLTVEAADVSPRMIEAARRRLPEDDRQQWWIRSFEEPSPAAGHFDVALCVGNSLALAPTLESVERALMQMLAAVRPGGKVVVQVLNLPAVPEGPVRWQPAKATVWRGQQVLVCRGIHRCSGRGFVEFVRTVPTEPSLTALPPATFLGLEATILESMARRHGASAVTFMGGFRDEAYEREKSQDLLMIAERVSG